MTQREESGLAGARHGSCRFHNSSVLGAAARLAQILALRRRTALVFQCYLLFAIKTARENVINALITMQRKPRAKANPQAIAILREMGLADRAGRLPRGAVPSPC